MKKDLIKNDLWQKYIVEEKSTITISKETGWSKSQIIKKLKEFKIPRRSTSRLGRSKNGIVKLHNKTFGKLTAIEYIVKQGWLCKCECGNTRVVRPHHLLQGKTQSCGCIKLIGPLHKNWKGYGELSGHLMASYKEGAKSRGLDFTVSAEWLWELFIKQNKCCKLTNLPLSFGTTTASPDRIDSNKGYIEGNIQWVHKTINLMKWNLDQAEFIEWCKLISKNNP